MNVVIRPTRDFDLSDLLSLEEAARLAGRSPITLRWAARDGKLYAHRVGQDWVTTGEAVATYMAFRARGPVG